MKIFAKADFRVVRIKNGFTMAKLARMLGVSRTAMGLFERRKNGISPEKSRMLLDILGVEFDDVFELVERGGD